MSQPLTKADFEKLKAGDRVRIRYAKDDDGDRTRINEIQQVMEVDDRVVYTKAANDNYLWDWDLKDFDEASGGIDTGRGTAFFSTPK